MQAKAQPENSARGGRGFGNINATDDRIKKFEDLKIKNFKDVMAKKTPMENPWFCG